MKTSLALLIFVMTSHFALAGNKLAPPITVANKTIVQTLGKMNIQVSDIEPSPLPGIKSVLTDSGVFYVSEDGKYLFQGPLFDIGGKKLINVSNLTLNKQLDALIPQMIVYKAPKQRHVVTVFTDISCGYCQKLHKEIKRYNDKGITIRYLAYPRSGLNSEVAANMRSVWCAKDPAAAMNQAMENKAVKPANCPIDLGKHLTLGTQYGVQGTPALLLEDGTMLSGYQSAESLSNLLNKYADDE